MLLRRGRRLLTAPQETHVLQGRFRRAEPQLAPVQPRRQLKTYLDEATAAKNEASDLKRQLFKAQQRSNNNK